MDDKITMELEGEGPMKTQSKDSDFQEERYCKIIWQRRFLENVTRRLISIEISSNHSFTMRTITVENMINNLRLRSLQVHAFDAINENLYDLKQS